MARSCSAVAVVGVAVVVGLPSDHPHRRSMAWVVAIMGMVVAMEGAGTAELNQPFWLVDGDEALIVLPLRCTLHLHSPKRRTNH